MNQGRDKINSSLFLPTLRATSSINKVLGFTFSSHKNLKAQVKKKKKEKTLKKFLEKLERKFWRKIGGRAGHCRRNKGYCSAKIFRYV